MKRIYDLAKEQKLQRRYALYCYEVCDENPQDKKKEPEKIPEKKPDRISPPWKHTK